MCEVCGKSVECRQIKAGPMLVWVCSAGDCAKKFLAQHRKTV